MDLHLSTELITHSMRIIAQCITHRILGRKHQELIIRHREPELLRDVVVVCGRFVARATGAVETCACVDARCRDVAVVFAGDGVASSADGMGVGSRGNG